MGWGWPGCWGKDRCAKQCRAIVGANQKRAMGKSRGGSYRSLEYIIYWVYMHAHYASSANLLKITIDTDLVGAGYIDGSRLQTGMSMDKGSIANVHLLFYFDDSYVKMCLKCWCRLKRHTNRCSVTGETTK